jgi:hypothetical protein
VLAGAGTAVAATKKGQQLSIPSESLLEFRLAQTVELPVGKLPEMGGCGQRPLLTQKAQSTRFGRGCREQQKRRISFAAPLSQ